MLAPLLTALRAKFTGTPAIVAAFPGGYHLDEAPEGSARPYLIVTVVSAPTDLKYGGVCRADVQLQFAGWGPETGTTSTLAAVEAWCALLDEWIPTLSSGTVNNTRRLGEPVPHLEDVDPTGGDLYQAYATYEFNVRP